jgi:hypothetical protein
MTRSHVLLHCPNAKLRAAREEALEKTRGGVRVFLANPRWRRFVKLLELQSDLVIPDLAVPDPSLYRTVRDQRFPTHQNLPRCSGRSPNTGPDGIPTAVIPVPHTKYIRYTGRLLTSWNTDSANHLGSPPLLVHTRALPYTKSTTHCCSRIGNCSFLVFVFQLPIPIINRPNSIA